MSFEKEPAFLGHLGIEMTGWERDFARFEVTMGPHLSNRTGNPHGGLHATLLDAAMGFCGCWVPEGAAQVHALTLSLTVNYLSRPRGTRLIGEGRRTGGGRSTFFAEGTVHDDLGEEIATATGVFRYRNG